MQLQDSGLEIKQRLIIEIIAGLSLLASSTFGGVASTTKASIEVPVAATKIDLKEDVKTSLATTTGDVVREYFKDTPVMADIAWCESRMRQFEKSGEIFRGKVNSDDVGVMQINTEYHQAEAEAVGDDLFTLDGNLDFAKRLFEKEGTKPWMSSSKCWVARSNTVALK